MPPRRAIPFADVNRKAGTGGVGISRGSGDRGSRTPRGFTPPNGLLSGERTKASAPSGRYPARYATAAVHLGCAPVVGPNARFGLDRARCHPLFEPRRSIRIRRVRVQLRKLYDAASRAAVRPDLIRPAAPSGVLCPHIRHRDGDGVDLDLHEQPSHWAAPIRDRGRYADHIRRHLRRGADMLDAHPALALR